MPNDSIDALSDSVESQQFIGYSNRQSKRTVIFDHRPRKGLSLLERNGRFETEIANHGINGALIVSIVSWVGSWFIGSKGNVEVIRPKN